VICLMYEALSEWHFGEIASCQAAMAEAIALAKELNHMHSLAQALWSAAVVAHCERNPAEVKRYSSDLTELSTRHGFKYALVAAIFSGWGCSTSGDTGDGVAWIENGIRDFRASGAMLCMPYYLALKAEALYLTDRASEALEAISEAEATI